MNSTAAGRIAFQGELGAYSHQACRETYPDMEPVPCPTFEDVIALVRQGDAQLAMLPIENTTAGSINDFAPGIAVPTVIDVMVRILEDDHTIVPASIDQATVTRARELAALHLP